MKVLFVAPYAPNPIRVRSYSLIRKLAERGHQVTVATNWTDGAERQDLVRLRDEVDQLWAVHLPKFRSAWNCLRALPSRTPLQAVYSWNPSLARRLDTELFANEAGPSFDVIHVEHLRGAQYGLRLRGAISLRSSRPAPPIVWDSVDCISLLFEKTAASSRRLVSRLITRVEFGRTQRFERFLMSAFDHVLVTSAEDQHALEALSPYGGSAPISVLANGVDLDRFSPAEEELRTPFTLLLSGKMSYHANHTMVMHFVKEILPLIRADLPHVKVWIVGKGPSREIVELGRDPAIQVTGEVAEMAPYMRRASLAVVPITYGTGIQNKVLEAMACATPVVATSQASSALSAVDGRDLIIADGPLAFAQAVLGLLQSPAKRLEVGGAGRRFVEQHHSWGRIAAELEQVYDAAYIDAS